MVCAANQMPYFRSPLHQSRARQADRQTGKQEDRKVRSTVAIYRSIRSRVTRASDLLRNRVMTFKYEKHEGHSFPPEVEDLKKKEKT
ncbi:hypothetical protein E2C01_089556 [Portunus trituberculatus]|uniref:Uncharacterized protein n=1 Tax=Portunus trituberculatus TaxID=210409 RepID=A0A5B7JHJ9_PORTR|nr:hypothetical protein [Portunus trituberculatus]